MSLNNSQGLSFARLTDISYDLADPLAQAVWDREDGLLIVTGAPPCIRNIYFKALAQEKLDQFLALKLDEKDFILGLGQEKLQELKKEIRRRGRKTLVFYLSCMDILSASDYSGLKEDLEADGFKVLILERGPMVKGRKKPAETLRNFLSENEFIGSGPYGPSYELPPYGPGNVNLANLICPDKELQVMLSPGGCGKCWKRFELTGDQDQLYASSFGYREAIFGLDKELERGLEELAKDHGSSELKLLSSPLTGTISVDLKGLGARLKEEGISLKTPASHGYDPAPLTRSAYLKSLPSLVYKGSNQGRILLVDPSAQSFHSRSDIQAFKAWLEKHREDVSFYGQDQGQAIRAVWFFSLESRPLAKDLALELGIPAYGGFDYTNLIKTWSTGYREQASPLSLGLVTDPLVSENIKDCIRSLGLDIKVKTYIYAPDKRMEDHFKSLLGDRDDLTYFKRGADLAALADKEEAWIGDPVIARVLKAGKPGIDFHNLTQADLTGSSYFEGNEIGIRPGPCWA